MARNARYLIFKGQYEGSVLGTFRIIRGFANLKDLAKISVPYEMEDAGNGVRVKGQQRKLDPEHAERIKRYLESGEQRFLPEVILSIRGELDEVIDEESKPIGVKSLSSDDGILIERIYKSRNIRVHRVRIERKRLGKIQEQKLIRRVDGNHRLALAEELARISQTTGCIGAENLG